MGNCTEGSNPSLSAKQNKCSAGWRGIFHLEAYRACPVKRTNGKCKGAQRRHLFCFDASPSGISEANPSLSAEKLKHLQIVEFEGVLLFELFLLV
jgi:hypothetical protein